MADGERIQLQPNGTQGFDSACRTLQFLSKRNPDVPVTEVNDGALDALLAAGEAEGCSPDGTMQVTPGANSGPGPNPVENKPPRAGDHADDQGAPPANPPVTVAPQPEPTPPPTPEDEPRDHPDGWSDPRHSAPRGEQQVDGGDPIDLFTGAFVISENDLSLRTSTSAIDLVRRYRSNSGYYGPFGWAWDHNHNQYLRVLTDGSVAVVDRRTSRSRLRIRRRTLRHARRSTRPPRTAPRTRHLVPDPPPGRRRVDVRRSAGMDPTGTHPDPEPRGPPRQHHRLRLRHRRPTLDGDGRRSARADVRVR